MSRRQPLEVNDDCCPGGCGGMDRRRFLQTAGLGIAALSSVRGEVEVMAGPFSRPGPRQHFVPADKRLSREWVQSLYERGTSRVCRGAELNLIGMPVGGIGAGQVYVCGDGTLASWKIFNRQYYSGSGQENYRPRMPDKPFAQGFAVVVEDGGKTQARLLNRQGFPGVEFVGEYPLAHVRYADAQFPVHVELTAYSPFIPLNAKDSALPATVLEYAIENRESHPVSVSLVGWLENAVCFHHTREDDLVVEHRTRVVHKQGRTLLVHSAAPIPVEPPAREDVILADFEGGTYGNWSVEGEAFGDQPAPGTLPHQNPVDGFLGQGLVNSFRGGDQPHGRLVSPEFPINRRYINFLIGGGRHPQETCINLIVDGAVVRTATGRDSERLLWESWGVQEFAGRTGQIEIVDRHSGRWGHINVDQVLLSDQKRVGSGLPLEQLDDFGSMSLGLGEPAASLEETNARLAALGALGTDLHADAEAVYRSSEKRATAMATPTVELAGGQRRRFVFVVTWHFPNRPEGNMYANWFDDAADVAHYVFDHYPRLSHETRLWHDTYYDSTLPHWLLDRLHYPVCNLATGTCQWWKNGRFWAWEGVGCCHGTCTHVWNYAQAAARLFPELERSAREMQDLGVALHENGLVGFRGEPNRAYAADGQAGTVLKCYREHQISVDDSFLRRCWPKIRKVLEYSITQDGNDDGLIENSQHNTYDINFEGANTFVGSLYLAALRAGEEMAREAGDTAFAERVHRIFEAGRRLSVERLWNGEYFVQQVDLEKYPENQYGDGCLSDQLFGQGWAHQLGLGYLYPPDRVRQALESIWKYNWAPDVGPQNAAHKPERWFVSPGEAGLFTCTWPRSEHLDRGVRYRDEVWTGIEYQVAGHLIWENTVEPGLAIVRGVHDRYDARKHNPFNEVECGDHYARALASWGVYLALCGYEHHGPKGHLGFAPRLNPENFQAAFTAAQGWGTYSQQRDERSLQATIALRWGRLRLTSLALPALASIDRCLVQVRLGELDVDGWRLDARDDGLLLRFDSELRLSAGDTLHVTVGHRT